MALQVTVTGATGFIAGALIQQLLEKGYTVNATVRDASLKNPKTQHLQRLAAAFPGDLHLFEADLNVPGAFDVAVNGSTYVFHVASPVAFVVEDNQRDLVDPAVNGTKNVLASVLKSKATVRRVIVTSSVVAAKSWAPGAPPPKNGQTYSEEDWNETSTLEGEAYALSKVLAEKAAWAWHKKTAIPLVTVNPVLVIGPLLYAGDSETPKFMKATLEGAVPDIWAQFVDVRDVARAHVLAAEVPSAKGRYFVGATAPFNQRWLLQVLKARFPQFELQEGKADPQVLDVDNSKAIRELGMTYRPMSETVIDMAVSVLKLGIATPKLKAAAPTKVAAAPKPAAVPAARPAAPKPASPAAAKPAPPAAPAASAKPVAPAPKLVAPKLVVPKA